MTVERPPQTMVIGFIGRMGSGKTLNMSKWVTLLGTALDMPIWANYHLRGANYFTKFQELADKKNIIVAYDEIHVDFDSRDWDKKTRYQFTQWFTQMRKLGIIFVYATQRHNTLEKRIRENTDYLFWCTKINKAGTVMFREFILDAQLNSVETTHINTIITYKPHLLYPLYDTREIIKKDYYKSDTE
ncbi:zonular occludens toxin domain-containing protein [Nocardia mangyaensis]|uniref:zonular occludens toxin domain-containing protein n=1 Tax=Nocardia mangyaensis TaxID=2213200 RepID=UPI002674A7CD|nr:zonular occludens toxin domain-containing protein [Nocardia mangyaensis]MDO3651333.1 zonular occludens toxin domain-containing protein [Nocardia mangyaensis]